VINPDFSENDMATYLKRLAGAGVAAG